VRTLELDRCVDGLCLLFPLSQISSLLSLLCSGSLHWNSSGLWTTVCFFSFVMGFFTGVLERFTVLYPLLGGHSWRVEFGLLWFGLVWFGLIESFCIHNRYYYTVLHLHLALKTTTLFAVPPPPVHRPSSRLSTRGLDIMASCTLHLRAKMGERAWYRRCRAAMLPDTGPPAFLRPSSPSGGASSFPRFSFSFPVA
jgi:hypothetical protein